MIEPLSTILIAGGTSGITGFITWLFSRRKYNQEVDENNIKNLQDSLDFYVKLSDDNNKRLGEILERNDSLDSQILELKRENNNLKDLVEKQTKQIKELSEQIEHLMETITTIKK